jgi:peroxiredoxin
MSLYVLSMLFVLFAFTAPTQADDSVRATLGKTAPEWTLLDGTDGKQHSSDDYKSAKAMLVVFLCNHCPCAKSYEERFKEFAAKYLDRGVKAVAFNCDLSETLDAMKQRTSESKFGFDYLRDANQEVGRGFPAQTTPHVFVLDANRKIVFSGSFDDDKSGKKVTKHFAADAIEAVLAGKEVKVTDSSLCGCAISYSK